MFRSAINFILFCFLVASCAQVGTISGGEVDESAPIIQRMTPEDKGTNVTTNAIELEFDEFIQLNNPSQTIQVIPPDFKVDASVKGKNVSLKWSEAMQPNTTYSIFLNKTILDITENNDSIMQLVFSTGAYIDSLSYTCFVKDAMKQSGVKKCLVGLFSDKDSLKPMYFSQTNEVGKATFSYLKSGNFFVRAFDDVDGNLSISRGESVGFKKEPISIDDTLHIDSIPILLFKPILKPKITSFTFQSPGTFVVGANHSLAEASFTLNGSQIAGENMLFITKDSLQIFHNPIDEKSFMLTTASHDFIDSIKLRLPNSNTKTLQIISPSGNSVPFNELIAFQVNDKISYLDTAKLRILNADDSSRVLNYTFKLEKNTITFDIKNAKTGFIFEFEPQAIVGATQFTNKKTNIPVTILKEKELGSVIVDVSAFNQPLIIELLKDGKKVKSIASQGKKQVDFKNLNPGQYTFKVVIDDNGNELWDTGNFEAKRFPEEIISYSEPTVVRANWEISVTLAPSTNADGKR